MKKIIVITVLLQIIFIGRAQKYDGTHLISEGNYLFINAKGDTIRYNDPTSILLRKLKDGSVIVRLKLDQKRIDAYRKTGQNAIADQIESYRKNQNKKIYAAFKKNFEFCEVFFIYSKDTKKCLEGQHVFLNEHLEYDSSINLPNSDYVFCEYGTYEAYSKFSDISGSAVSQPTVFGVNYDGTNNQIIPDSASIRTGTNTTTSTTFYFIDKNLDQLERPFPAPRPQVFINFNNDVNNLNRDLENAYYRLVYDRAIKQKHKEQKGKSVIALPK